MIKIFISHSTKDIEIVQFLEKILKTYGYTPYIAERDYQAGKPLSQKIMNNIDNSNYFLIIYTDNGKKSGFVNQEIGYWIKAYKYENLIPLVEKDIIQEGFLSGLEYIEIDPLNPGAGIENSINYLEKLDNKTKVESSKNKVILGIGILGIIALIIIGIYLYCKNKE